MAQLDLSSLESALQQLERFFARARMAKVAGDLDDYEIARTATIQAFEYSYELSYKMLKRYFEMTESDPSAVEKMTFDEIIRLGYVKELLDSEVSVWREYRKKRGTTSHTYNAEKAEDVFAVVPAFLKEAEVLFERLKHASAS